LNLTKEVIISSPQMIYFSRESRKYAKILPVSSYDDNYENINHYRFCKNCSDNFCYLHECVNKKQEKEVENLEYLGILNNYLEWFKCKICGQLWPVVGFNGFDNVYNSAINNNIYKSSIGIGDGYGRNLQKIRNDLKLLNKWEEKIELINNSWKNKEYFNENV